MKKWTVYMIEAENGFLYTGITTDLSRRFSEHSNSPKAAKFFRRSPPRVIRFSMSGFDRSEASKIESGLKKLDRATKEKWIANPNRKMLKQFLKKSTQEKP